MEFFEVTARDHWRQVWPMFLYAVALIAFPYLAVKKAGGGDLELAIAISAALIVPLVVSHIVVHLRFSHVSRNLKIGFSERDAEIVIVQNGIAKRIKKSDISDVEVNVAIAATRSTAVWFPWQSYRYAIIRLLSGEKFLITNLHVPYLEWPFQFVNVMTKTTNYWWPPDPNSW